MRWHPQSAPRRILRWARWLALASLLSLLLLAALAQWWLLPRLNDYRDVLATTLGDYLHFPVRIESITAVRDGWQLGLRLQGVTLQDPAQTRTLARFSQATITLDLWRSLDDWRPILNGVRLEGAHLALESKGDGALRLLDEAGDAETATALSNFAHWLFSLPRLEIVGEQWAVRRPGGFSLHLLHPYLQLQEVGDGQRLNFTAQLPDGLGDRIELTVERPKQNGVDPVQAVGQFAFRANRLDLAGWPLPLKFAAGRAAFELNGDWQNWRPLRLRGSLRLEAATPAAEPRSALLKTWLARSQETELRFEGQHRQNGWELQGSARYGKSKNQTAVEPTFEFKQTAEGWRGGARGLRAQDVLAWSAPWLDDPARDWLVPLDPRGELPEISLQTGPDPAAYFATVQLRGLACRPVRGLPGFDNVSGVLAFGPDRGRIDLRSRQLRVDASGILRAPISLDSLIGTVDWRRSPTELRVESAGLALANPDLNGRFWGSVTLPDAGQPVLDVRGHYWAVRAAQVWRYLPVAVIPEPAVAWLDRAFIGGRVAAGDVVFRGPPARFPFDHGEGLFETRFQFEDATVNYMPGWPKLEQGRATVLFRNRGLQVDVDAGRLLEGELDNLAVRIDDLANVIIRAKGRGKGPGASMWRALKDSPAGQALGEDLPNLQIEGNNTLDLDLAIPLDSTPIQIGGRVGLMENNVELPSWNIELGRLRGEVRFTETTLAAEKIQTLLRGEPMQLDLDLIGREGSRELRARLRGQMGIKSLLGEQGAMLERYFSGKSGWEAVLAVPTHRRERANTPLFGFELTSDLRGIAVRLPAPLGKPANEARTLKLNVRPSPKQSNFNVALEYGRSVRAALALSDFPRQPRLERGELRINAGSAQLPEAPGLAVIAHLPRWSPESSVQSSDANTSDGSTKRPRTPNVKDGVKTTGFLTVLRRMEARIDDLVISGRSLGKIDLKLSRSNDEIRLDCEGESLAGRVTVPDAPTPQRPVNVALQRAYVSEAVDRLAERPALAEIDPRQLPSLVVTVGDLRIGEIKPGRLRVVAIPGPAGIHLTEISLNSERQRIAATGQWRQVSGRQVTELDAKLEGESLGGVLAAFGYPNNGIERGKIRADAVVEWGAALPDFQWDRLRGTLKLQVGPGQLRDINPGFGRMIGMLNVKNLTRRLSFDFSDLLQPGMGFDQISGHFAFERGQARTDDLSIEAPAAHIKIQGAVGLQVRNFDQTITVTPHFGGALPVAGTIAGGPVVGAAVFVAEQLLQKNIEQATRYRYTLKGSWDNPVVEYVQESSPPAEIKGFASDNPR